MSFWVGTLSQIWLSIQQSLFPWLEDELVELSEKEKQLVAILELIRIESFVTATRVGRKGGRPEEDRGRIARAFAAKAVYNMGTTRELIERLGSEINLRRLCGWERKIDLPSEATFSRGFAEFAKNKLGEKVHAALIEKHEAPRLVGHISRDSTQIKGRERALRKEKKKKGPKRKQGRPKKGEERAEPKPEKRLVLQQKMTLEEMIKDLPIACDVGSKVNSKGFTECWTGYKLHIDVADGQIPISCILSSASVHDSQVALPLATMTAQRVTNLYDLMDSAYDAQIIREHSISLNHKPIIEHNKRHHEKREFAPHEKARYKERTSSERVNARLKDEFGGRMIRVRGSVKVMASLMFGILVLAADELLRLAK
jgi:transposase